MNPIAPAPVEPRVFSPEEIELLDRYLIAAVGVVAARPVMHNATEDTIAVSAARMCEAMLKARTTLLTGMQPDFHSTVSSSAGTGRGGAGVTTRVRSGGGGGAEPPGYAPQPRPQPPPPAYGPQGGGGQGGGVTTRVHSTPSGTGDPSMVGPR